MPCNTEEILQSINLKTTDWWGYSRGGSFKNDIKRWKKTILIQEWREGVVCVWLYLRTMATVGLCIYKDFFCQKTHTCYHNIMITVFHVDFVHTVWIQLDWKFRIPNRRMILLSVIQFIKNWFQDNIYNGLNVCVAKESRGLNLVKIH